MNRRGFFKALLAGAALAAIPPVLLKAAKPREVYVTFSTADHMMCLDDFEARILEPAMKRLAERIDADCIAMLARAA